VFLLVAAEKELGDDTLPLEHPYIINEFPSWFTKWCDLKQKSNPGQILEAT